MTIRGIPEGVIFEARITSSDGGSHQGLFCRVVGTVVSVLSLRVSGLRAGTILSGDKWEVYEYFEVLGYVTAMARCHRCGKEVTFDMICTDEHLCANCSQVMLPCQFCGETMHQACLSAEGMCGKCALRQWPASKD